MRIGVLDVCWDQGAPVAGAARGPDAIRQCGLIARMKAEGLDVDDHGAISLPLSDLPQRGLGTVATMPGIAHATVRTLAELAAEDIPLVLGGDHSIALGTLPAMSARATRQGRPLFVLWIDAHPDCHSPVTTETGNLHGMPLAAALGVSGFDVALPRVSDWIAPDQVLGLGVRSIDPAEQLLITELGLTMMTPASIRQDGLRSCLGAFLDRVAAANGVLHVSLDADALDPAIAPGVGTPVPDGLTFEEVSEMLQMVASSGLLGGLEIVEVDPTRDEAGMTAERVTALVLTALALPPVRKAVSGMKQSQSSTKALQTCDALAFEADSDHRSQIAT
jgi:arginase